MYVLYLTAEVLELSQYSVEVLWHPAFELLMSLEAYMSAKLHKVGDLGSPWRAEVKRMLPKDANEKLHILTRQSEAASLIDTMQMLAWAWPDKASTVDGFIAWASTLEVGELFSTVAGLIPKEQGVPRDLSERRDNAVSLMQLWSKYYFQHIDPAILSNLAEEASKRREMATSTAPMQLVEDVSGGVIIKPEPAFSKIVLIPQYHALPWNLFQQLEGTLLHFYPADAPPATPEEPSKRMLRLTGALSDTSRLRILRYVAESPRSFTEIAKHLGITKATVHYHLVLLRAAGLLRVETFVTKMQGDLYTLRRPALSDLSRELDVYLGISHSVEG